MSSPRTKKTFLRMKGWWCSHQNSGFSLLELLIVVVVLALVGSLVLPAIGAGFRNWQLRTAAGELVSELRLARAAAVSSKKIQGVRLDLENNRTDRFEAGAIAALSGMLEDFLQRQFSGILQEKETFVDLSSFGEGEDAQSSGVHFILFFPRGNSSGGTVTLRHLDGGDALIVQVSPITGRVEARSENPDNS